MKWWLIIIGLAILGVAAFLVRGKQIACALHDDVFKLSYQFLLIVVIGGAVSLLYKAYTTEEERVRERHTLLREMHSELLQVFNDAKKVRRSLRALIGYHHSDGFAAACKLVGADYKEKIDALIDAQLAFEVYAKRAQHRELWFARGQELSPNLDKIERYLNQIIREYEEQFATFEGGPKLLSKLPKLAEFLAPYDKSNEFRSQFAKPMQNVLAGLAEAGLT